jgi:hypothetical protein
MMVCSLTNRSQIYATLKLWGVHSRPTIFQCLGERTYPLLDKLVILYLTRNERVDENVRLRVRHFLSTFCCTSEH